MVRSVSEKAFKSQTKKIQTRLKQIAAVARTAIQALDRLLRVHDRHNIKEKLSGGKRKRVSPLKGKRAPIKYRDKQGNKWSGRGRTPKWLVAAEKTGIKRDRFAV